MGNTDYKLYFGTLLTFLSDDELVEVRMGNRKYKQKALVMRMEDVNLHSCHVKLVSRCFDAIVVYL